MSHEHDHDLIACEVCKKEIPKAAALNAEGGEYVLHYCSIECMDVYKKEQEKKDEK